MVWCLAHGHLYGQNQIFQASPEILNFHSYIYLFISEYQFQKGKQTTRPRNSTDCLLHCMTLQIHVPVCQSVWAGIVLQT